MGIERVLTGHQYQQLPGCCRVPGRIDSCSCFHLVLLVLTQKQDTLCVTKKSGIHQAIDLKVFNGQEGYPASADLGR